METGIIDYNNLLPSGLQFVQGGPYIPASMLKAHERGDLVFLCGAGVSRSAGLPSFKGLVDCIYEELEAGDDHKTAEEQEAYDQKHYDVVLQRLAGRLPGNTYADGLVKVKQLAAKCIGKRQKGAAMEDGLHHALMSLSFGKDMSSKIVTTNYDNLLSRAYASTSSDIQKHVFPSLPLDEDWNGVAHIHGSIPCDTRDDRPNEWFVKNLVLTDTDLGRAYTSEFRVAGNFLRRLTAEKSVCFIGYSISDTEVRHLLAALPVTEGSPREHFAFVPPQQDNSTRAEDPEDIKSAWESKGVTPISYSTQEDGKAESGEHALLEITIKEWAKCSTEGKQATVERIVACGKPDNHIDGQKLKWSLSDVQAAWRFSQIDPTPSIDWFPYLEPMIAHTMDPNLVHPVEVPPTTGQGVPAVSLQLLTWLSKYAHLLGVFKWFLDRGGSFAKSVDGYWEARLEDTSPELPDAMRTLWGYLTAGAFYNNPNRRMDTYRWIDRVEKQGITTALSSRLHSLLSPKITHGRGSLFGWTHEKENESMGYYVSILGLDVVVPDLENLVNSDSHEKRWHEQLSNLLPTFSLLLEQTCEYLSALEKITEESDMSCIQMPSIEPHEQNLHHTYDWAGLIELTRDAWDAMLKESPALAEAYLRQWAESDYPCFRRLALYGCSNQSMPTNIVQSKLAEGTERWLWNIDASREVCRFFAKRMCDIESIYATTIEDHVIENSMSKGKHWVWLYLTRMEMSGYSLSKKAQRHLDQINDTHPEWSKSDNDRHELNFWMESEPEGGWISDPLDSGDSEFGRNGILNTEIEAEEEWEKIRELFAAKESTILADRSYANSLCSRMETAARNGWASETEILEMSGKILAREYRNMEVWSNGELISHPLQLAINHPHGRALDAIMHALFRTSRNKDSGLPDEYRKFFNKIMEADDMMHAKCIIASQTNNLFIIDEEWVKGHLLPKFSLSVSPESTAVWSGFFRAIRIVPGLVKEITANLTDLAEDIESLPELKHNHYHPFVRFLVWSILLCDKEFFRFYESRLRSSIANWNTEKIAEMASALYSYMEQASEKEVCWSQKILPFYKAYFPKKEHKNSYLTSHRMGEICLLAGEKFAEAVDTLKIWLSYEDPSIPRDSSYEFAEQLIEKGLDRKFPRESLVFLDAITEARPYLLENQVNCLENIESADPGVEKMEEYIRLRKIYPVSKS